MKRRGNRRYYQHHEVLMIRRIRELLYDQGFTIQGARNRLQELVQQEREWRKYSHQLEGIEPEDDETTEGSLFSSPVVHTTPLTWDQLRVELVGIRNLLKP